MDELREGADEFVLNNRVSGRKDTVGFVTHFVVISAIFHKKMITHVARNVAKKLSTVIAEAK